MDPHSAPDIKPILPWNVFYILVLLLVAVRFLYFGDLIDAPHAWRQCDTANYIYDFHHNGIDLLRPSVCWMGHYKTLILEFPLPEAFVAVLYDLFGEYHWLARLFFLGCFLGAAYFFYRIVSFVFDLNLATIATLVFLSLPLSLFYSRAIHIDFFAVFMVHGMVYFWLKAIDHQLAMYWICGMLFAIPGFLVKVPYAFYFALPLAGYAIHKGKFRQCLRWFPVVILPVILFWFWQSYAARINSLAPDWEYILGYRKFDDNSGWYFGNLKQRLALDSWIVLGKRLFFNVCGLAGMILASIGIIGIWRKKERYFVWLWLLGGLIYLLTFFNLNLVHDYYQIPFLALASIFIASGILFLTEKAEKLGKEVSLPTTLIFLAVVIVTNVNFSEKNYFQVEKQVVLREIGAIIRETTESTALPIVTYGGFDSRCPLILYRARRNGWSVPDFAWTPEVLDRLANEEGATHFVLVDSSGPKGKMLESTRTLRPVGVFKPQNTDLKVFIWRI